MYVFLHRAKFWDINILSFLNIIKISNFDLKEISYLKCVNNFKK